MYALHPALHPPAFSAPALASTSLTTPPLATPALATIIRTMASSARTLLLSYIVLARFSP